MECNDEYTTVEGISKAELCIKKSRFIGLSTSVNTEQEAMDFLRSITIEFPSASHYCYAYNIGCGSRRIFRSNDAGEPTNSAGKPILTAIEASGLRNVICVVVRYFGGIKLGVGGLIRAYGQTARDCLKNAKRLVYVESTDLNIQMPNEHIGAVVSLVTRLRGKVVNIDHGEKAFATVNIRNSLILPFRDQIKSISCEISVD
jgi:uncharacterized YigZ family protein